MLQAVYFKLRFSLSYRDVEELMQIRGVKVDHATIQHWVFKFTPLLLKLGAIKSQTNKGGFEYQAKNKWASINLEYSKEATRLGREFGFTPSARTQIGVNYSPTSELDKIMFGE